MSIAAFRLIGHRRTDVQIQNVILCTSVRMIHSEQQTITEHIEAKSNCVVYMCKAAKHTKCCIRKHSTSKQSLGLKAI